MRQDPVLTLADLPERQARYYPDEVAFRTDDGDLTFTDVRDRVAAYGSWLAATGLTPGDRIVTIVSQGPDALIWFLAIVSIGGRAVPVNLRLAPKEVSVLIDDADPRFVLVEEAQRSYAEEVIPRCPDARWVWAPGQVEATELLEVEIAEDDDALILYTSGSTGDPKGCVLTHRSLLACNFNLFYTMRLRSDDRYLATMPMFHIGGLAFALAYFHAGAMIVVSGTPDPSSMVDTIDQHGITFAAIPFLSDVIDEVERRQEPLESLRVVAWGSQMETSETVGRVSSVLGAEWRGMFGSTETGNVGFMTTSDEEIAHPGTIGRPVPGIVASVRDTESGRPVPDGGIGELCVRGPSVMRCYWRRPEVTAETIRDGWVRTGDLARFEGGRFYFEGRVKDMIKSGGENVFAVEVETHMRRFRGISDVAVFGVPDPKWGEAVHAAIVASDPSQVDLDELEAFLRGELAGYKVPKRFHFVAEIPRTLGKVLKKDLRLQAMSNDREART